MIVNALENNQNVCLFCNTTNNYTLIVFIAVSLHLHINFQEFLNLRLSYPKLEEGP